MYDHAQRTTSRRTSRLLTRLFAAFLLVAFVGLAVAAFLVDRNVARTTRTQVEDRLSYETMMLGQMTENALFGPLDASDTSLNGAVHRLGEAVHTQLSLIALDGRVAADSAVDDPQGLPRQLGEPEVSQALIHGQGTAIRGIGSERRMFVVRAIVQDGHVLGFARSSLPMSVVDAQVHEVQVRMAMGALVAGIVALLFAFVVSTRVTRPVRALTEGALRIGAGDLDTVIRVDSRDEIGDLAEAFNKMTGSLRHTIVALDSRNNELRLVLDNVSQGLLVIDRDGVIASERSASIDSWFGAPSSGATLWSYLERHDAKVAKMARLGWLAVCDGLLPLQLNLEQMPKALRVGERAYELAYEPILSGRELRKALIVVSDVTDRLSAQRVESQQREFIAMLDRILRDRTGFLEFMAEAEAIVRRILSEGSSPVDMQRELHTLRGNASVFGFLRLSDLCRELEASIADTEHVPPRSKLDELAARWRELEARFISLVEQRWPDEVLEIERSEHAALLGALDSGRPSHELKNQIRDWQLDPMQRTLERFAGHARGLAQRLGKGNIEVSVVANGVRIERDRFRPFWAAFMHVVRNAVDHGLETPAERRQQGKPETGRIRLEAVRSASEVRIEISDDGRGVDWHSLARIALEKGIQGVRPEELLFIDGLSTRTSADDVSGRGVGMAAARAACRAIGGDVAVTSSPGNGTTLRFTIPLGAQLATGS
ncbi:MAG TPA: HAMP domain-containing protein, partial [Polyangiaceae bacterium]